MDINTSDTATMEDMCLHNQLYRPDPAGHGYAAPIPLDPSYCPLSMLFSDWDRSGRADLRIKHDRQTIEPNRVRSSYGE